MNNVTYILYFDGAIIETLSFELGSNFYTPKIGEKVKLVKPDGNTIKGKAFDIIIKSAVTTQSTGELIISNNVEIHLNYGDISPSIPDNLSSRNHREFNYEEASEMFSNYLIDRGFQKFSEAKTAIQEIQEIDYRPYLFSETAIDSYYGSIYGILRRNGLDDDNANIFIDAMNYLTNDDNGFGNALKKFSDKYFSAVRLTSLPENQINIPNESSEFGIESGGIILTNKYSPARHIDQNGDFTNSPPVTAEAKEHIPGVSVGEAVIGGSITSLGAILVTVSLPVPPLAVIIGAAVIVSAVLLEKPLRKAGIC